MMAAMPAIQNAIQFDLLLSVATSFRRLKACPHWRQKLPKTATNCRQFVARNGNKCCRKRQQKSLFPATFVAKNGDFLSPFSATTLAGAQSRDNESIN